MINKRTHYKDHLYCKVLILRKLINQMKSGSKIFKCSFLKFRTFHLYLEKRAFEVNFQIFNYKNRQIYKTKILLKNKLSKTIFNN